MSTKHTASDLTKLIPPEQKPPALPARPTPLIEQLRTVLSLPISDKTLCAVLRDIAGDGDE